MQWFTCLPWAWGNRRWHRYVPIRDFLDQEFEIGERAAALGLRSRYLTSRHGCALLMEHRAPAALTQNQTNESGDDEVANRTSKAARGRTSTAKKAATPKAPRVKKEVVLNECACAIKVNEIDGVPIYESCGGKTPRSFLPGHDARLKGALIRAHRAGQPLNMKDDGEIVALDPMKVAASRGWESFLLHEVKPRAKRPSKARKGAESVKVKIGRSTVDAVVTGRNDEAGTVDIAYTNGKGDAVTATVNVSKIVAA